MCGESLGTKLAHNTTQDSAEANVLHKVRDQSHLTWLHSQWRSVYSQLRVFNQISGGCGEELPALCVPKCFQYCDCLKLYVLQHCNLRNLFTASLSMHGK